MKTQIKQLLYGILATSCFSLSCTSCTLGPKEYQWPPKDGEPIHRWRHQSDTLHNLPPPLNNSPDDGIYWVLLNQLNHIIPAK